jgi:hypothetical protein
VSGRSGRIDLEKPLFAARAELDTGRIEFSPAAATDYRFNIQASGGVTDRFVSSDNPAALSIEMKVRDGQVARED